MRYAILTNVNGVPFFVDADSVWEAVDEYRSIHPEILSPYSLEVYCAPLTDDKTNNMDSESGFLVCNACGSVRESGRTDLRVKCYSCGYVAMKWFDKLSYNKLKSELNKKHGIKIEIDKQNE